MGFLENKYGANTLYQPNNGGKVPKTNTTLSTTDTLMSNPYTKNNGAPNLTLRPTAPTVVKLGGGDVKTEDKTVDNSVDNSTVTDSWFKRNKLFVIGGIAAIGVLTTAIVLLNKNK